MKRQVLIIAGKYGLGFGLVAAMIWWKWDDLVPLFERPMQVGPLVLATAICLVSVLITFVRWYVLVRAQDLPITLTNAIRLGLVGFFFSIYLPGSVGGDIVKAIAIAREQQRRTVAVATVIIDRIVGLWALVWLVAILGSAFWFAGDAGLRDSPRLQYVLLGALAVVALSTLAYLALFLFTQRQADRLAERLQGIPKVGGSAAEFWRAVWMYRDQWRSIVVAMLMSLVGHVGFVLTFYYAALVFIPADQIPTLPQHFLIVPIGMTIQAAIPLPNGIGVGELGYGLLYAMVLSPAAGGIIDPDPNGLLASLTQRLIYWGLALIGYLVYLRMPAATAVASVESAEPEEEPGVVPEAGGQPVGSSFIAYLASQIALGNSWLVVPPLGGFGRNRLKAELRTQGY